VQACRFTISKRSGFLSSEHFLYHATKLTIKKPRSHCNKNNAAHITDTHAEKWTRTRIVKATSVNWDITDLARLGDSVKTVKIAGLGSQRSRAEGMAQR
jgi:hypothetical protein